MVEAREDIEERTVLGRGEPHAAGGDDRHVIGAGEIDERLVVRFLVAQQMPLQFDVDVRPAEQADQPIEQAADAMPLHPQDFAARQRDEAARMAIEFLERQRALPFRRAQLHARDQATQVAVAVGGLDEDGQEPGVGLAAGAWRLAVRSGTRHALTALRPATAWSRSDRQLRADDRAHTDGLRRPVKARGTIDAIAIEQRKCRVTERCRAIHQRFGQRGALQKAEGRGGVEFDVRRHGWGSRMHFAFCSPRIARRVWRDQGEGG